MSLAPLPIDEVLPGLIKVLADHRALVLRAPPGAGKTTRVAPAMLDAGLLDHRQLILVEPRRLAARAAATRIAQERGSPLGGEIGYQVRFDRAAGADTRVLVVTEGMFLRILQDDPLLERVSAVVFDEFHERNLDADLGLALARRVQAEVREDLRLVVMSATLESAPIAAFLGRCPTIDSPGRSYPVDVGYVPHSVRGPLAPLVAQGVADVVERVSGHVLVFLPGVGEIRQARRALEPLAASHGIELAELYGDLPLDQQQAVLRSGPQRKIVLATNVAESSITIDGVAAVVDTGLARVMRYDAARGLNRLVLERISQASTEQRAGRAGRTGPGICLRLWAEREQRGLPAWPTPEIARVDLAGAVLQLVCWGHRDVKAFAWFETPPTASLDRAQQLLERLGAIDRAGRSTRLGELMNRLPVEPRLARLLVEGERHGERRRAALIAAMLSERDPFETRRPDAPRTVAAGSDSDVLDRLQQLERSGGERASARLRQVLRAADQLERLMRRGGRNENAKHDSREERSPADADEALGRALIAGFPDRIARRREPRGRRGLLVGGRGVRLADTSAVSESELFVCVDIEEQGRSEAVVRQASGILRQWLPAERIETRIEVEFDRQRQRVVAWRRVLYDDLVLEQAPAAIPPEVDPGEVVAREAAARADELFDASRLRSSTLVRIECLRSWMPELELPALDRDGWLALLPELCAGCLSLDDLRRVDVESRWLAHLTHAQRQALERHAPERLTVPSGSSLALTYEPGKPPILSVRIQEIFGWRESPKIAGGRVRVVLELLGPNMRPQQITGDLASFWKTTYEVVRKELKRRYPKHAWPDDPLAATAVRGVPRKPN